MRKWDCLWLGNDSYRNSMTDMTICTSEISCKSGKTGNFVYEGINYLPKNDDFIGNNKSFIGEDKEHPIGLGNVELNAKNPNPEKTLEERIEDLNWSAVRPNENGNTCRYNHQGRTTDQSYSDDFLKWYCK